MIKKTDFSLFILCTLPLQARAERKETKDTLIYSSTQKETPPSGFKKAIKRFLNFSDFDTLYIKPNRYNYALMSTYFSNFEYYSLTSKQPQPQKLIFSPNPHHKIGLYFGWRWIFVGWSVAINDISRKTNRRNKSAEIDLNLYSSKMGLDLFYRRTGNNYKIHRISGFSEETSSGYSSKFDGLKVDIKGLNIYYIFNNRRFSYPAAFSQSTNQVRNTGSFIAGFSYSDHKLEFNYNHLPDVIQENMNPAMKIRKVKYSNAAFYFGYAYNWVFAKNWLACLSVNPGIAYKASKVDAEAYEEKDRNGSFSMDFLGRTGVVYNNGKYFVGTSFVGKIFNYQRNGFSLNNGFGTLQLYAGFNFNLRKQYRKKTR